MMASKFNLLFFHVLFLLIFSNSGLHNYLANAQQEASSEQDVRKQRAESLKQKFNAEFAQGKYADAIRDGRARVEILERSPVSDNLEVARAKSDLAAAYNMSNDSAQAQTLAEQAVDMYERAGAVN